MSQRTNISNMLCVRVIGVTYCACTYNGGWLVGGAVGSVGCGATALYLVDHCNCFISGCRVVTTPLTFTTNIIHNYCGLDNCPEGITCQHLVSYQTQYILQAVSSVHSAAEFVLRLLSLLLVSVNPVQIK